VRRPSSALDRGCSRLSRGARARDARRHRGCSCSPDGDGPYADLAGQPAAPVPPGVVPLVARPDAVARRARWACRSRRVAAALAMLGWRERAHLPRRVVEPAACSTGAGRAAARSSTTTSRSSSWPRCWHAAPVGIRCGGRATRGAWGWPVRTSIVVVTGDLLPHRVPEARVERAGLGAQRQPAQRDVRARLHGQRRPTDVSRFIADRPRGSPRRRAASRSCRARAVVRWCGRARASAYVLAVTVLHAGVYLTHGSTTRCGSATAAIVLIDWRPGRPACAHRAKRERRQVEARRVGSRASGTPAAASR
jgi:hypothetical protein